jgi:S-methylmethionine-dependent homocysteine/selenocysteine methylase
MYAHIKTKLDNGELVILDGGTGTDIQRRGVKMDSDVWCAEANRTHPEVVRAVHDDYIRVGAEVITANTYASAPLMFNAHGRDADLIETDTIAMRVAREAADAADHPVCVAGSISVMRPIAKGTDDFDPNFSWDDATVRRLFDAKAANLKACGADLLIMEMMRDTKFSSWAVESAVNTGLPVWVGIAVERNGEGALTGVNHPDQLLEPIVRELTRFNPDACLIMHSPIDTILEGLEIISANWSGPTGAYPEAGEFTMPDWQFVDIAPADFAVAAQGWRDAGAQIIGGCCGVTPDHIAALSTLRSQ